MNKVKITIQSCNILPEMHLELLHNKSIRVLPKFRVVTMIGLVNIQVFEIEILSI